MVDLGLSSALRSLSYASLTTSSFLSPFPSGPTHTLATHRKSFSRAQHPLCSLDVVPKRGRVVVAGGTGFIGRKLVSRLSRDSAEVVVLARNVSAARSLLRDTGARVVAYDASTGPLSRAVASEVAAADAIVNLAGEPVDSGRWTPTRKRVLWDSRVVGTALLARAATKSEFSGAFITASAVGFYGTSENRVFTEEAPAGEDFLGTLARAWENAAWRHTRSAHNVRTVVLRIGVVLGPDGGALQKMKRAFDLFVGGPPGSGKQWFSFVHREDVVELIVYAIDNDKWSGTYNLTAPTPVRLGEFCSQLGRVLSRPNWLPLPGIAVKAAIGSEAADLILAGQHVDSTKAQNEGYHFRFNTAASALEDILQKSKSTTSIR